MKRYSSFREASFRETPKIVGNDSRRQRCKQATFSCICLYALSVAQRLHTVIVVKMNDPWTLAFRSENGLYVIVIDHEGLSTLV